MARQSGPGRDLTTGSVATAIWATALPIVIGNLARTTYNLVDMKFVGYLGADAAAAVGISGHVMFLMATVFSGVSVAAAALVARAVGQGDYERADHFAAQSLLLALVVSLVLGAVGYAAAPWLLEVLGASASVEQLGSGYLRIIFLGIFAAFFMFMGAGVLHGAGDMLTPLVVGVCGTLLNIALDPLLIFGPWWFPEMGIRGAALATVVSQFVSFLGGLYVLASGRLKVRLTLPAFRPDLAVIWRLLVIGAPASVRMSLRSLMGMVMVWLVAPFGTAVLAAYSVGNRVTGLGFMPTFGIAEAAGALVGQNLGAHRPDRARRGTMVAVAMAVAVMGAAAIAAYAWAPQLVRFFIKEKDAAIQSEVVAAGVRFLRIVVFGHIFAALGIVLSRALNGAGDTVAPMLITLLVLWGVEVPAAVWLSGVERLAETGIWWAMVFSSLLNSLVTLVYFCGGRWERLKVMPVAAQPPTPAVANG